MKAIEIGYRKSGAHASESQRHTHENRYEIILVHSGSGQVVLRERMYPLTPGTIYFINAINIHMTKPDKPDEYVRTILKLNAEYFNRLFADSGDGDFYDGVFRRDSGAVYRLSPELLAETERLILRAYTLPAGRCSGTLSAALVLELISTVMGGGEAEGSIHTENSDIAACLKYINEHLSENISLSDISGHVNLSKYYLCRLFKHQTGVGITEYCRERRLSAAKELLVYSDLPVSEIAISSGFESFAYFSSVFRASEGLSPREYRNKSRSMNT